MTGLFKGVIKDLASVRFGDANFFRNDQQIKVIAKAGTLKARLL